MGVGCSAGDAEQRHEPPDELSDDARTFARICTSLIEEAEAINWYHQRLDVEKDEDAWRLDQSDALQRRSRLRPSAAENGDRSSAMR